MGGEQSPEEPPSLSTHAESPRVRRTPWFPAAYVKGVVALAAAYFVTAKLGQALRYTGSVSAIWPPVGLGIAALYLWGFAWWPGLFIGDFLVNLELYVHHTIPIGSLIGQQTGNMIEIVGGAWLLRMLIGPGARLDRVRQISGVFAAGAVATAASATIGTVSLLAGGVIAASEVPTFWRTWWLGDLSGVLVILPLIVVWIRSTAADRRRLFTWSGAAAMSSVLLLTVAAVSTTATVTYLIFPALVWAALRFRAPGATLAVAITAAVTIGMTADNLGAFSRQQIDNRTLSTQLYITIAALTALLLSAIVSEGERSMAALEEAKRREGERTEEERYRIARELHDSVSQVLFSTVLQIRTAQKELAADGFSASRSIARSLSTIGGLVRTAQSEMRALIFELRRTTLEGGLARALSAYGDQLGSSTGLRVTVQSPTVPLSLSHAAQAQLFAIAREALANVVKHSRAGRAEVVVSAKTNVVVVEVRDDGCGFDVAPDRPGHYGLESIRDRASELGGKATITSSPGAGTAVRVEVPAAGAVVQEEV
jgi:signal transduction histidine kinase